MPKYGIHQIVLKKAVEKLEDGNANEVQAANDINTNLGIANLGAIGPDLLFWAPDYEYVDKLFQLYKNIDEIIDEYNRIVQPVRDVVDAVGEATEEAVSTLAPNTVDLIKLSVEEMKETATLFKSSLATNLFTGVISTSDWMTDIADLPNLSSSFFNLFTPPLQEQLTDPDSSLDIRDWYWFDALHYRRVGIFSHELKRRAQIGGDSAIKAFTYGYLSHITTDVTGHAYVNQIVGAPYRLNIQRHITVENFMDTWAFNHYYDGENVSKSLLSRMQLPQPSDLPSSVVNHIDQSLRSAFSDSFPTRIGSQGFLSQAQIRQSYETLHTVLNIMEKMVVDPPEEPFAGVGDILARALEDLLEPPPSPPSTPSDMGSCDWDDILSVGLSENSRDCYENFFDEVEDWMNYLGELMLWTFESAIDLLDLILATLTALPITVLLALLYAAQLLMYELYLTARSVLAELGFFYPDVRDLNSSKSQSLITTILSCSPPFKYPNIKDLHSSHLVCQISNLEQPTTVANFFSVSESITPENFIESAPFSISNLVAYSASTDPQTTRDYESRGLSIGNAVDFTSWMISAANSDLTSNEQRIVYADWNLDSDRGYGYKSWDSNFDPDENQLSDEAFMNDIIDPT